LQAEKAIPVQHSCRILEASRSGFYADQHRARQPQALCTASVRLKSIFEACDHCYGSRRLQSALNDQGITLARSLMQANQLKPIWKPKFVYTTDSKHDLPVFDNVLDRQFTPTAPNQA
jgi:transposase InsO family protein